MKFKKLLSLILISITTTSVSSSFLVQKESSITIAERTEIDKEDFAYVSDEDLGNGILEYGMYHGMFLKDGKLFGFGNNPSGEVGVPPKTSYGDKTKANTYTELVAVSENPADGFYNNNIEQVKPGWEFTLVLREGVLYSFGGNEQHMLGDPNLPTTYKNYLPKKVPNYDANGDGDYNDKELGDFKNENIKKVSGRKRHVIVVTDDGYAYGWGHNTNYRKIAYSNDKFIPYPKLFTAKNGFVPGEVDNVFTHYTNTTFIMKNGDVYGQGYNYYGQHGSSKQGNGASRQDMQKLNTVNMDSKVIQVEKGYYYSVYLTENGKVYYSGDIDGAGSNFGRQKTPILFPSSPDFPNTGGIKKISQGQYHTLFLNDYGEVLSFGGNGSGQLGNGNTSANYNVSYVLDTPDFTQGNALDIKASWDYSFIIDKSGQMIGAGSNNRLQLGVGSATSKQKDFYRLVIKDTVLPKVTVKESMMDHDAVGTKTINHNESLADLTTYFEIEDPTDGSKPVLPSYITSNVDITTAGTYEVTCTYTTILGISGTARFSVIVLEPSVVITNPGVIEVEPENKRLDSGSWDYDPFKSVEDQIEDMIVPSRELNNGSTTIELDTGNVDYQKPGVYPVTIIATDKDGNTTTVVVEVEVGRNDAILSNLVDFLPNKSNWWGWLLYFFIFILLLINDDEEDEEREAKLAKRQAKIDSKKQRRSNRKFHLPSLHMPHIFHHSKNKVAKLKRSTKDSIKNVKLADGVITKSRTALDAFFHHLEETLIKLGGVLVNFITAPFRVLKNLFSFNFKHNAKDSINKTKEVKSSKKKYHILKHSIKSQLKFGPFAGYHTQNYNKFITLINYKLYKSKAAHRSHDTHKYLYIKNQIEHSTHLEHYSFEINSTPYYNEPIMLTGDSKKQYMFITMSFINNKTYVNVYKSKSYKLNFNKVKEDQYALSKHIITNSSEMKYKALNNYTDNTYKVNLFDYNYVSNILFERHKREIENSSISSYVSSLQKDVYTPTSIDITSRKVEVTTKKVDIDYSLLTGYKARFELNKFDHNYYFMIIATLTAEMAYRSTVPKKTKKKFLKMFKKHRQENIKSQINYRIIDEGIVEADYELVCETLIESNKFYHIHNSNNNIVLVYSNLISDHEMEYALLELSLDGQFNSYNELTYKEIIEHTKEFSKHI